MRAFAANSKVIEARKEAKKEENCNTKTIKFIEANF